MVFKKDLMKLFKTTHKLQTNTAACLIRTTHNLFKVHVEHSSRVLAQQ